MSYSKILFKKQHLLMVCLFLIIFICIILQLRLDYKLPIKQQQLCNINATLWYLKKTLHFPQPANAYKANSTSKPWYFKNGVSFPKPNNGLTANNTNLFSYHDAISDRIINQLMYVPSNYEDIRSSGKLKLIFLYGIWEKEGREVFLNSKCPVDTCILTRNHSNANTADMIVSRNVFTNGKPANSKQINLIYILESAVHTSRVMPPDVVNWTATYRHDSDIVTPYAKWLYYDPQIRQIEQNRNYAENKTKKVAWFVSNCYANNNRLAYALELQKYIEVHIYGDCGNYSCSRSIADKCFEILDLDYKFYLAFENSNCMDYITEKFYENALQHNTLPIVMGARPEDYEISTPHRSYIHVDEFPSPKELAKYLHVLDKDDELYNLYFKWKGTGEFINTYFWCRVCALLHAEESLLKPHWYEDFNLWWKGRGICPINEASRKFKAQTYIMLALVYMVSIFYDLPLM